MAFFFVWSFMEYGCFVEQDAILLCISRREESLLGHATTLPWFFPSQ